MNYKTVINTATKFKTLISIILSIFLAGCVSFNAKSTPQKYYSMSVTTPTANTSHKNGDILEVYPPQIAPQFSGSSFVYRTSGENYISDYYNVFFGFPTEQIQQNSIKYLQAKKIFKYASDNVFPLKANYVLKTNITELYADYRDSKTPKAIISIQYVLINIENQPTIVFNKTFSESIPLAEKSSNALVDGWSKGLQKILNRLTQSLHR